MWEQNVLAYTENTTVKVKVIKQNKVKMLQIKT